MQNDSNELLNFGVQQEQQARELRRGLKQKYSGQITGNFLLDIYDGLQMKFPNILDFFSQQSQLVFEPEIVNPITAICDLIVAVHRSKIIFLAEEKRAQLEKDRTYREELIEDVHKMILLRPVVAPLIRTNQVIPGDRYLLFPVPYYTAAMVYVIYSLLPKLPFDLRGVYQNIAEKTLAALSLLQDNLLGCSYLPCRILLEEYFRAFVFQNFPKAFESYEWFKNQELLKSIHPKEPRPEFEERFKNRTFMKHTSRTNFLHYGWVDDIPGYHETVTHNPYSFDGLKNYVLSNLVQPEDIAFYEQLNYFHNMCHGFVHGGVWQSMYPLLHYFEISFIVSATTINLFYNLCEELGEQYEINGVNLFNEIQKHCEILNEKESQKSTENFDNYYKKWYPNHHPPKDGN